MAGCLDEHEVLEFAQGRVAVESVSRIERHLDQCDACFRLVVAISRAPAPVFAAISRDPGPAFGASITLGGDDHAPPPERPRRGEPRIPAELGGYRITATLGRGGMGVVYRGVREDGAVAAVKTVLAANPSALAAIRREAALLKRLAHPGVVRLVAEGDGGADDGRPWFAMELVESETLADWLAGAARERGQILDVLRKLAETLAAVHGRGVVHGDLTPRNILVRADGSPVLVDFGLACELAGAGRETWTSSTPLGGTPAYVSPEQVSGEDLDARADLYALGCILYECLTGGPPFAGDRDAVLRDHLERAPEPPSRRAPGISRRLDDLALALLAKQPQARPAYALDVVARLAGLGAAGWPAVSRASHHYVYRPRLAGRTAPLETLGELITACAAGRGAVVLIAGPSGAGKTRLVAEATALGRRAGLAIAGGRAMPLGLDEDGRRLPAGALHPLRPLIQELVDRCEFAGPAAREHFLGREAAVLAACFPELRARGDEPAPEGAPTAAALLAAAEDLLLRMAAMQPLAVVLDDLQWADELTLALLPSIARRIADHPLLVIATCRDDAAGGRAFHDAMAAGAVYLELGELDLPSVGRLVADMLAVGRAPAGLVAHLEAECGGNPLEIAEHLRALVAEGVLRRVDGGWWVVELPTQPDLARTRRGLAALIERRLEQLSPDARGVAEIAAVLAAPNLEPGVLAAIAGLSDGALADALGELVESSVLDEDGASYRFLHDKLREIAYGALEPPRRRALHAAAAAALEAREGDAPVIAHHYLQADRPALALPFLEHSADAAFAAAVHCEAARLYRVALAAEADAIRAGEPPVAPARRARWERRLGEACYALGDLPASELHSLRAVAGFGHPLPGDRRGWWRTLGVELARRLLPASREPIAARRRDLAEAARATSRLAHGYLFREDLVPIAACSLRAVNLAARVGPVRGLTRPYAQLAYLASVLRLDRLGAHYHAAALDGARALGDPEEVAVALYHRASHHVGLAEWEPAERLAREAASLLAGVDAPQERELVEAILAYIELSTGRYADARARGQRLRAQARARRNRQFELWGGLYTIARCALAQDRPAEALNLLGEAGALLAGAEDVVASHIVQHGLAAAAHARLGAIDAAAISAHLAMTRVARRPPSVFTLAEGYAGIAEAWLAAEAAGRPGAAAHARASLGHLAAFAAVFPVGRPAACWLAARAARLRGHRGLAGKLASRAVALAERSKLPDIARRARLDGG